MGKRKEHGLAAAIGAGRRVELDLVADPSEKPKKKTTAGRRKIPIQKIQEKSKRSVAFSKRRMGLFKKAGELSTLCGSEVAVIAYSEGGKAFAFGHPSPDSVVNRYLQHQGDSSSSSVPIQGLSSIQNMADMGLEELEAYAHGLQMLLNMVIAKATSNPTSSLLVDHHPAEEFSADVDDVLCPLAPAAGAEEFSADVDDVLCPLAAGAGAGAEEFSADVDDVICPLAAGAGAEEEVEFDDVVCPSLEELMELESVFYGW